MNEQIKNRIEQIMHGQVPVGYKKTEVGIVPREWEMDGLKQHITLISGQDFPNKLFNENRRGTPYLTGASNILNNEIIENRWTETPKNFAVSNDILIVCKGAGVGKIALLKLNKVHIARQFMAVRPFEILHSEYCYYMLSSFCQQIKKTATGMIDGITRNDILSLSVVIPSFLEQQRIAEILMKWDEAIALQEKLIDKLELQKKALMQRLLNPKDGWVKIKLGKLMKEQCTRNKIGCTNVMSVSNKFGFVKQEEQFSKQVASADVSNYKVVHKGNIAYNPSRINVGSIAIYENDEIGIVSPMYVVIDCTAINPKLLLLLLDTNRGKYNIQMSLSGSVRDSLNYSDLETIQMRIPPDIETTKIVETFSCHENYINSHKQKLTLLKSQQKSLMQLLLTGIVRV